MGAIETFLLDLKYALRQLRRNPGFAAAAIVSLALGIGANTAAYSVLNAVLFRSLPLPASAELFKLTREARVPIVQRFSYRAFEDLRGGAAPGNAAAISQSARVSVVVDRGSQPERANVQLVSGEFFHLLGVAPAVGRLLEPADDRTLSAHPVAVLSHGYWRQRFAGAQDIVGQAIALNGSAFRVVGVAADRFSLTARL